MAKIGVVLSGCGVFDGSEIQEAVFTLLALSRRGHEAVCMAPDLAQHHVIDHITGKEMPGTRNVLVEAARIARGRIRRLADVKAEELDALIFPGGFGVAKNLSRFAFEGPDCSVLPEVAALARAMQKAGKPLGFACIAPALAALIFRDAGLRLTIGSDEETAGAIRSLGQAHEICAVRETCVDEKNRVVSTPAYMCDASPAEVCAGIDKLVDDVCRLAAGRTAS